MQKNGTWVSTGKIIAQQARFSTMAKAYQPASNLPIICYSSLVLYFSLHLINKTALHLTKTPAAIGGNPIQ